MKTALVTGASSGIGRAIATSLIEQGYRVFVAARRVEKMRDLEKMGATAIAMDISKEEEIVAAVEQIERETDGLDILVNNAGFGLYGAVEDVSIEEARYQFEVNLFGLGRLTQLVLPQMRRKKSGRIINISSMGGRMYTPLGAWYHATKHALEGWSDALRLEVQPFGIDVVVIQPGIIGTEFGDHVADPILERSGDGSYADMARRVANATQEFYAKGRTSPPSVIANTVLRALNARRPKTRYVAGKMARPLMMIRKWFGDRVFDRVIMAQG